MSPCHLPTTHTHSELYALDLRTFRSVLAKANESGLMSKVAFLRKVKLLEGLGDNQITRIAGALSEETFKDGHYIIRQGDIGDAFYLISDGKVKCTSTKASGEETDLITIGEGDYFGEMALMLDEPRHANCIAVSRTVTCFKLSKADFMNMFGPLQALLEKQMRLRILRSVPLLSVLNDDELSKVRCGSMCTSFRLCTRLPCCVLAYPWCLSPIHCDDIQDRPSHASPNVQRRCDHHQGRGTGLAVLHHQRGPREGHEEERRGCGQAAGSAEGKCESCHSCERPQLSLCCVFSAVSLVHNTPLSS